MSDTGAAKLPGLPVVSSSDPAMQRWIQAVTERLEVREGRRGNKSEAVVLQRDIGDISTFTKLLKAADYLTKPKTDAPAGNVVVNLGGGLSVSVAADAFGDSIRNSALYKDLMLSLDDPKRFDALPQAVRDVVLQDIAAVAARLGAAITRVETKTQSALESLAMRVDEVTAAVDGSAAGVRETVFAQAAQDHAQAGKIFQAKARLDGKVIPIQDILPAMPVVPYESLDALKAAFEIVAPVLGKYYRVRLSPQYQTDLYSWRYNDAAKIKREWHLDGYQNSDGTGSRIGIAATLEGQSLVTADRLKGAESKYTLKVQAQAGNNLAVAGFGMMATANDATAESAFIIMADKFSLVGTNTALDGTITTTAPTDNSVPFGVDTKTKSLYMKGNVYLSGNMQIYNPNATALTGQHGQYLGAGLRGSLFASRVATSSTWGATEDVAARAAIEALLPARESQTDTSERLIIGDTVTLTYTPTVVTPDTPVVAMTRQWNSSAWVATTMAINGDVIVDGTLSAHVLNADVIYVGTKNIALNAATMIVGNFAGGSGASVTFTAPEPCTVILNGNVNFQDGATAVTVRTWVSVDGAGTYGYTGTNWNAGLLSGTVTCMDVVALSKGVHTIAVRYSTTFGTARAVWDTFVQGFISFR